MTIKQKCLREFYIIIHKSFKQSSNNGKNPFSLSIWPLTSDHHYLMRNPSKGIPCLKQQTRENGIVLPWNSVRPLAPGFLPASIGTFFFPLLKISPGLLLTLCFLHSTHFPWMTSSLMTFAWLSLPVKKRPGLSKTGPVYTYCPA